MSTFIVGPRSNNKPPSAELSSAYQAGVRAYAVDYYVPEYIPQDTDLLCAFRIEPKGVDMIEAAAASRRRGLLLERLDRGLVQPVDRHRLLQGQGLRHR